MTSKAKALGDSPAFPVPCSLTESGNLAIGPYKGMSTRTWLVGMAMQALVSNATNRGHESDFAKTAVIMAEATLEELAKEEE